MSQDKVELGDVPFSMWALFMKGTLGNTLASDLFLACCKEHMTLKSWTTFTLVQGHTSVQLRHSVLMA